MFRWITMVSVPMIFTYLSVNPRRNQQDCSKYCCENDENSNSQSDFFWYLAVLFLVLFAGLRIRYNDTTTYLNTFADDISTPVITTFLKQTPFELFDYWGYKFVKSLLKTVGMDSRLILLTFTTFYTIVYMWFIRKYSRDYLQMATFVFIADGYLLLLAALKQVTATAIALIAIDRFFNHKRGQYIVLMLIAVTFHPYVLVLLVVPFVYKKKPWTKSTWIIIAVMIVLGLGMESTANIIAKFNDVYDASSILNHTMNPWRFAVSLVPIIISFMYRDILYEDSSVSEDLFTQLSVCRTMFYFWALFGNPIVFARISNYFDVFNAINIAWAIDKLCRKEESRRNGEFLKTGLYVCFLFFSYMNGPGGFDFVRQTEHIGVGELIHSFTNWMNNIL